MPQHDEKVEYVNGIRYRYSTEWINSLESELRWRLYWQQQKMMEKLVLPGQRVLEIGVGSGFTANYLRSKGIYVTTLDIDPGKKPDIVANIVKYEFEEVYDHILAFEVFEHIPFEQFIAVVKKLSKVCQRCLFLSVPRNEKIWMKAKIKLPLLREINFTVRTLRKNIVTKNHFWEVDHPATPKKKFEQALIDAGFAVTFHKQFFSFLYYVLESSNNQQGRNL